MKQICHALMLVRMHRDFKGIMRMLNGVFIYKFGIIIYRSAYDIVRVRLYASILNQFDLILQGIGDADNLRSVGLFSGILI